METPPSCIGNSSHSQNISFEEEGEDGEDDAFSWFYEEARFVTGLILYPIICTVGLVGNSISLVVLSHRKMVTSTNVFLSALAAADILKLLNDLLYFLDLVLLRVYYPAGNALFGHMYPVSHYIFNQTACVSAWLTVSVAVERYVSVCHAARAKDVCTVARARALSVAVIFTMSFVALPSAMRYVRSVRYDPCDNNSATYGIEVSYLGSRRDFMAVYNWTQNLLRSIIPLFALCTLNSCIIHSLRRKRVKGKNWAAKNRITLMLIVVIVVFIVCILPDAVMSTCFGFGYVDEKNLLAKGVREYTDTLLAIHSAANSIIYCVCSRRFREIFLLVFGCQVTVAQGQGTTNQRSVV